MSFSTASKDHYKKISKQPDEVSVDTEGEANDLEYNQESLEMANHKEWAKTIMRKALESFIEHCEREGLSHYRVVFERHVLEPAKYGFPKQKETAEDLNKSVKDIENINRRSQRLFRDKVVAIVRETV